jgi:hypothetical protein
MGGIGMQTRCKRTARHLAAPDGTGRHEGLPNPHLSGTTRDGAAPDGTNGHELQNRCAGESWQAGSIPVRLRSHVSMMDLGPGLLGPIQGGTLMSKVLGKEPCAAGM